MSKRKVAIGIDLGTTNSCVGFLKNGRVEIIPNCNGHRITPSCVGFDDLEFFIGDAAKEQAAMNNRNTVFDAKRLIGRKFSDAEVQNDMRRWPFEVLDVCGTPKIRVQYREEERLFTPEEISAKVLHKLKGEAIAFIGEEVRDAVITVPANFNDSQRQATLDAGKIAGLNVLKIFNEPTAAALAYAYLKKSLLKQTVLVYDLGGGTFDVSILEIIDKNFVVKAVGGNTHLGGGDFDNKLLKHFLEVIITKYNKHISQNPRALGRLREACETAKKSLSSRERTTVTVVGLIDGEDFQEKLSRGKFEHLCMDLFQETITIVENTLKDAGIANSDIDEVILVGGSSRIPKIQNLLSTFFDGKKLNSTINPDEAVAYGAAVKAAVDSGEYTIEDIYLTDVVPLSLGLSNARGKMVTFIKRNTRYPVTVVQENWTTCKDYQASIRVTVYEGERELAKENHLLGRFEFDIGERELQGVPKNTHTFHVDENGILHVSSVNKKTQRSGSITITTNKGRLTSEEIERMRRTCEQNS